MSTIHFIGGEKGGVGKSLMARILAQYFIDHGHAFLGFDCDRTHGALLRFYTQYSAPVAIDDYQSLDRLVDLAVADPARAILVDLAAQAQQPLSRWMTDSRLLELAPDLKISLVYWHVMDNGFDSVELLRQLLDRFGQKIKLVLVLNQLRGERFELLETSGQRTRAEQMGASSMPLQRLECDHAEDRRQQPQLLGGDEQWRGCRWHARAAGAATAVGMDQARLRGNRPRRCITGP
jgi:hypothetical protein